MAREDFQFKSRLPYELKERLAAEAERAKRSLSAEVVARLEASFEPSVDSAVIRERAATLQAALDVHQRIARISSALPTILATFLRDVLEDLPTELRSSVRSADVAYALANAVMHNDGDALADTLAPLLLPATDVEQAKERIKSDIRASQAAGLKRRVPADEVEELRDSWSTDPKMANKIRGAQTASPLTGRNVRK
jgi:predicted DNA-binding protein